MDPTKTEEQPELPTLDQLPANEYRAVREGKTVADVVAARPAVEEVPPAADPSTETPVRDAAGRFVQKVADKVADAVIADRTAAPASKAGNPRHDPKARVEELKGEIAQLAKEKGDTKAERDAIAADIVRLKAEKAALEPAAVKAAEPSTPGKIEYPAELKSYEAYAEKNAEATYEEYMDARGDFRNDHRSKAEKAEKAEQAAQSMAAEVLKPFKDRETAFKAKTADYDDVIQRSPVALMPLPPWVIEEIRTSEHGPALRYYLAQHPDETAWMAGQPKAAAVSFLKGLFTPAPGAPTVTPAAEPQTKADPPFETVGASAAASTHSLETVAAKGSAADFRRLREGGVRQ